MSTRSNEEPGKSAASFSSGSAADPRRGSAWWDDRVMNWTLNDSQVRVQLFRFIDALPALRSASAVRRHLSEYLDEAGERVPWWLKLAVGLAPAGSDRETLLAWSARSAAGVMARKFIAGATPDEAARTVLGLRRGRWPSRPICWARPSSARPRPTFTSRRVWTSFAGLPTHCGMPARSRLIDRDQNGPIPRVNLSLKLSSLTTHFDPIHSRVHARERGGPAAADLANGPRSGRLCSCRYGAVFLACSDLRHFSEDSGRTRVP